MTDDAHDDQSADDGPVSAEFEDEVRRMLQRRASDIPATDELATLTPTTGRAPWPRRAGVLAAVAAVVVAAIGVGVASWRADDEQQLAVGGPTADGPGGEAAVLVPPEGDAFLLDSIDVAPADESPPEEFTAIEYGPADGGLSEGLAVLIDGTGQESLPGGTPVTPDQNALLADLGAVMDGPSSVSWNDLVPGEDGTRPVVTVLWHGPNLTTGQGLGVAAAIALDPERELDGESLPAGWATRSTSVFAGAGGPSTTSVLVGPWPATLSSLPGELPFTIWLVDWGDESESVSGRQVDVRGVPGLLVERTFGGDGAPQRLDSLIWHEGGMTHQLGWVTSTEDNVDLVGLADRLVTVSLDEARRRTGQNDESAATMPESIPETVTTIGGSTGTIDEESSEDTARPLSLATTSMPGSLTAPGPGAIEGGPPTTGPNGETTTSGPVTTIPTGVQSTEGADGSLVTFTLPEPLPRPAGEFLTNAIVPVAGGTIGGRSYEVGVSWSSTFGLCMGFDFDGAITEGGYPVECEPEPWIGGGGSRIAPGDGVLVFAFADAAVASASLELGGVVTQAEVYRVSEFPEFAFLVVAFPAATAEDLDGVALPGAIALADQAGQPVGWG